MKLIRPGFKTSEFMVAVLTAILNFLNNNQHWTTQHNALLPTAAAIAYIISRGLAKVENRP